MNIEPVSDVESRRLSVMALLSACLVVYIHTPLADPMSLLGSMVFKYFRLGALLIEFDWFFD